MAKGIPSVIDLVICLCLVAAGCALTYLHPSWLGDNSAIATMAGALFGASALLLGNWINRWNEHRRLNQELAQHCSKLKDLIAAEAANVAAGLIGSKDVMDAAVAQRYAGAPVGQLDLKRYMPRSMPFTDSLGTELLALDGEAVDAIVTLRSNMSETAQTMLEEAPLARTTNGFSLLTAQRISACLGHDMTILAQVFERIAPSRKLLLSVNEEARLAPVILRERAQPPAP